MQLWIWAPSQCFVRYHAYNMVYVARPSPSSAVHGWELPARAASLLSVRSTLLHRAFLQSALSYLIMDLLLRLVVISLKAGCVTPAGTSSSKRKTWLRWPWRRSFFLSTAAVNSVCLPSLERAMSD